MTEAEFRQKYPHSSDEQVRLYVEAVAAEAASSPVVEPDLPMPIITRGVSDTPLPERQIPADILPEDIPHSTYSYDPVPGGDLRDILLGFNSDLSPEQRQHLQNADMSESEMLAMFFDPKLFSPQHLRH